MKSYWITLPIIGLLLWAFCTTDGSQGEKERVLVQGIMSNMERQHFQPRVINDAFSAEVFDAYLLAIDRDKKFLTLEDIDALSEFRNTIDDELKAGALAFFNTTTNLLDKGIEKAREYMHAGLKTYDSSSGTSFEANPLKRNYLPNDEALKSRWKNIVKKEVFQNLWALEKAQAELTKKKSFKELTRAAIEQARLAFDNQFEKLAKQDRQERRSIFLNTVLALYGPHNEYLTPENRADFEVEISRSLQGIGVAVVQKEGYVVASEIIPGGPAWKSKAIEEDDLILKVAQAGGKPVDIKGFSVMEAIRLFRGEKGTEVTLTIQKPNGIIKDVSLIRDLVVLEEGLAKSALLGNEKNAEKVGYIQLPRFYFNRGEGGHLCSDDVSSEIEKLKKQGIGGLIIDLRNNRGGSMAETLKMIGFFIESGPLVQRQGKGGALRILNDEDESVLYDGELVVLVNNRSASASELFSATLQDYDRAVIVGSKSTFGKGTIQTIIDLDNEEGIKDTTLFPLGSIKMTIGQFIRVNGTSTQLLGVEPDIVLPDQNAFVESGEKSFPHALPTTRIDALNYHQMVNTNPNLNTVKSRCHQRIQKDSQFIRITKQARFWKEAQENTRVELNYKQFKSAAIKREKILNEDQAIANSKPLLKAENLPENISFIQSDPLRISRNKDWLKQLSEDDYVRECLLIMHDLLAES